MSLCVSFSLCSLLILSAPSTVSIMHQVSRTVDSITLSWSQPDQPNGVILDYELQYYEKVLDLNKVILFAWKTFLPAHRSMQYVAFLS